MSWYIHWDASFDLAKGGIELSFRSHEDMSHLLVQTSSIRLVDNMINRIEAPTLGPRYHILGSGWLACYSENKAYFTKKGLNKRTVLHEFYHHLIDGKGLEMPMRKEEKQANSYASEFVKKS